MKDRETVVVLENIRSAHNVGAIFRTADGAGVSHVYLVGYTPRPIDRFGRTQPEIKKTSLGASEFIPWTYFETAGELIEHLNNQNYHLAVVEQTTGSVSYSEKIDSPKVSFILGNEVEGVSDEFIKAADRVIEIPMSGQKESLNVSTTAGIILFRHRDG